MSGHSLCGLVLLHSLDNLGSSERLLSSPVPLFYSRHTARFLSFWLLLLPLGLYEPFKDSWNHIAMIPATALISVFLFGIEELATQMEEPFTILPMQAFCDKIGAWCNEIVSWTPGDNGMAVNGVQQRHNNIAIVGGVAVPAEENVVALAPAPVHVNEVDEKFKEPVSNSPSKLRKFFGRISS
jgi:Bestrophin, RFP-TM, chloride channel